jgi:hypothetical protein
MALGLGLDSFAIVTASDRAKVVTVANVGSDAWKAVTVANPKEGS